ncbi:MAG: hypothetical protein HC938_16425 [Nitrospira sp.]|nr:hypothetical protein [Nitrospira sp.]
MSELVDISSKASAFFPPQILFRATEHTNMSAMRFIFMPNLTRIRIGLPGFSDIFFQDGLENPGIAAGSKSKSLNKLHAQMLRQNYFHEPFDKYVPQRKEKRRNTVIPRRALGNDAVPAHMEPTAEADRGKTAVNVPTLGYKQAIPLDLTIYKITTPTALRIDLEFNAPSRER